MTLPPSSTATAVVDALLVAPGRADDDARTAIGRLARQILDRRDALRHESRLQHQVFRRIAGDEQFGEDDKVGLLPRGIGPRLARQPQITGDIADGGVQLRDRNSQCLGRIRHVMRRLWRNFAGLKSVQPAFSLVLPHSPA